MDCFVPKKRVTDPNYYLMKNIKKLLTNVSAPVIFYLTINIKKLSK